MDESSGLSCLQMTASSHHLSCMHGTVSTVGDIACGFVREGTGRIRRITEDDFASLAPVQLSPLVAESESCVA